MGERIRYNEYTYNSLLRPEHLVQDMVGALQRGGELFGLLRGDRLGLLRLIFFFRAFAPLHQSVYKKDGYFGEQSCRQGDAAIVLMFQLGPGAEYYHGCRK